MVADHFSNAVFEIVSEHWFNLSNICYPIVQTETCHFKEIKSFKVECKCRGPKCPWLARNGVEIKRSVFAILKPVIILCLQLRFVSEV